MKKSIIISIAVVLSLFIFPKFNKNENTHIYKNGKEFSYYQNASIKSEANYKNGKLDGDYIFYKENGEISKTYIYKMGKYIK